MRNPAPPGGWYFEGQNEFYPDVDDTCMALMVLAQARAGGTPEARAEAMRRGLAWMMGMQNDDGGWASFDRGNDKQWLTARPVRRPQRHDRSQHRRHHRRGCSRA